MFIYNDLQNHKSVGEHPKTYEFKPFKWKGGDILFFFLNFERWDSP